MQGQPTSQPRETERPNHPWSMYLVKVAGIPIYLHFTFLLLLGFIALLDFSGRSAPFGGLLLVLLVFASVALHELGHALMARRYGIQTENIVLYPIGGVARLRSLGEGMQEFWIAVAGPAVNVVIAIALYAALQLAGQWVSLAEARAAYAAGTMPQFHLFQQLMHINILLVLFNMIPAFPMDGGRVLRSLLSLKIGKERSTAVAAKIGQGLAILFFTYGLFSQAYMLMFIGMFIFLAAGQEAAVARSVSLTTGHRVRDAMITRFEVLQHGDSLGRAADMLLATNQQDFPVYAGQVVQGVLGRKALLQGLAQVGRDHYVAEVMSREFGTVRPDEDLAGIFEKLQATGGQPLLVFQGDQLIGYINQDNLWEFLTLAQIGRAMPR